MKKTQSLAINTLFLMAILLAVSGVWFDTRPLAFRPYDRLAREHNFAPNQSLTMERIGDLAFTDGNRRFHFPTTITFTTDRYGYRNLEAPRDPALVFIGDSYVVGAGINDDQTLGDRLSAELGARVYAYGFSFKIPDSIANHFLGDPRFKDRFPALVLFGESARAIQPRRFEPVTPDDVLPPEERSLWQDARLGYDRGLSTVRRQLGNLKFRLDQRNGLRVLLNRRLSQPGVGLQRVAAQRIQLEGRELLTLPIRMQFLVQPYDQRLAGVIAFLKQVDAALRARGSRLVYVPFPQPGTLYPEAYPRARFLEPSFLDALFAALNEAGIEAIDLRPGLKAQRFPYLYLPADTHWNPRGTALAAEIIAKELRARGLVDKPR